MKAFSNITFEDHVIICNNTAVYRGGAIFSIASAINFQQGAVSLFESNKAEDGGAIYTTDGTIRMNGLQTFVGNYAHQQGGALALFGDSKVTRVSPLLANFSKNKAAGTKGGAIFFTDPISTSYCNQMEHELGNQFWHWSKLSSQ